MGLHHDSQFVGFEKDRHSPASSSSSTGSSNSLSSSTSSSPTGSEMGDGQMFRKPYRLASNIQFGGSSPPSSPRPRKTNQSSRPGSSFDRLFGAPPARPCRPQQLTLSPVVRPDERPERPRPAKRRPQTAPILPVSPLTGHVIGTGGFKVVSSPSRPVRSPRGACHSPLR